MERAVQLLGSEYDEIEEEANCLFEDLGIKKYPADCFEVARLLGIELVKYSDSSDEDRKFMTSKYEEGFSTMTAKSRYAIYYNDSLPPCTVRFTIWYEIAHIQLGHLYENQGKSAARMKAECNRFATYAQAAMPFVIKLSPCCPDELMQEFGLGWTCANYVFDSYMRIKQYPNIVRRILSNRILDLFSPEQVLEEAV